MKIPVIVLHWEFPDMIILFLNMLTLFSRGEHRSVCLGWRGNIRHGEYPL
jgi:hypothetical protein